jgi:hypothetical protein
LLSTAEYIKDETKEELIESYYDKGKDIRILKFNIKGYHDPNPNENEKLFKDANDVDGEIILSKISITDVNATKVIKEVDYTEVLKRPIEVEVPLGDYSVFI